jgi:hypothetical protein
MWVLIFLNSFQPCRVAVICYIYDIISSYMAVNNNEELLKRIARLVKQNQELEDNVRILEQLNDKLIRENEKIKSLDNRLTS